MFKEHKGYYEVVFSLLPHRTNSITQFNAICLQPRLWSQTFCLDELETQPGAQGARVRAGELAQQQLQTAGWLWDPELGLEIQ